MNVKLSLFSSLSDDVGKRTPMNVNILIIAVTS